MAYYADQAFRYDKSNVETPKELIVAALFHDFGHSGGFFKDDGKNVSYAYGGFFRCGSDLYASDVWEINLENNHTIRHKSLYGRRYVMLDKEMVWCTMIGNIRRGISRNRLRHRKLWRIICVMCIPFSRERQ